MSESLGKEMYDSYCAERNALISEDRSLRRDLTLIQTATEDELKADQLIREIRTEEDKTIWSIEHEDVANTFAGMQFLSAKHIVVKTKLFKILSKMPKGGLLHGHLDAMVDNSFLLKLGLSQENLHISSPSVLTPENIKNILPAFKYLPPEQRSPNDTLSGPDYVPGTWIVAKSARDNFDIALGGAEGFDTWILEWMGINPNEAYHTHNSVLRIWEKFEAAANIRGNISKCVPLLKEYVREIIRTSMEDGISYAEIRIGFHGKAKVGSNGEDVEHRELVSLIDRVTKDVHAELTAAGRSDEFHGLKIIYSAIRFISCDTLEWHLDDCIKLKQEFPHMIAGFDLVANENTGRSLLYYAEPLLRFKKRVEELGLDIPFIFHAGETLGDGTEADNNLYDAILLGTKRIGHGFSMVKHPKLMQILREKNIPLEICPISNEILRLTASMPAHPLPILLNNGVTVSLNSDDPSVFGNMGLSFDFFQVLVASEVNGLMTLKDMVIQSLEHSTLCDQEKARALSAFDRRWRAFITALLDGQIVPFPLARS